MTYLQSALIVGLLKQLAQGVIFRHILSSVTQARPAVGGSGPGPPSLSPLLKVKLKKPVANGAEGLSPPTCHHFDSAGQAAGTQLDRDEDTATLSSHRRASLLWLLLLPSPSPPFVCQHIMVVTCQHIMVVTCQQTMVVTCLHIILVTCLHIMVVTWQRMIVVTWQLMMVVTCLHIMLVIRLHMMVVTLSIANR